MNKKQLVEYIKKEKWDVQRARAAIFAVDLAYTQYAQIDLDFLPGVTYSPLFCHFAVGNDDPFTQIINQKYVQGIAEKIYRDYLKNRKTIERIIKDSRQLEKKLDNVWDRFQKNESASNDELAQYFQEAITISKKWWQYNALMENKGEVIDVKIIPELAKKHGWKIDYAREVVSVLAHPEKQSDLNQERIDFLKICLGVAKNKKRENIGLPQLIAEYIQKYFWIKSDFCRAIIISPGKLIKETENEINNKKIIGIKKELSGMLKNFKAIETRKRRLLNKLSLDETDLKKIEFAQKSIFWLDERKRQMMKQLYYLFCFLEKIAERFEISFEDLSFYYYGEIAQLLESGHSLSMDVSAKRRQETFAMYERSKPSTYFYGQEARELLNVATYIEKTKEIKGMVASRGKSARVAGVVKIIHDPSKAKFKTGEILVTSMTRVEFVPLMRKARAIIADEGGLACHAAIVSRELNLPAIIGTKNATEILKDGDEVELDMRTGEIKILKSK